MMHGQKTSNLLY